MVFNWKEDRMGFGAVWRKLTQVRRRFRRSSTEQELRFTKETSVRNLYRDSEDVWKRA